MKAICNAKKLRHAELTAYFHVASASEQLYFGLTFGILPKTRQLLPSLLCVLSLHLMRLNSMRREPPSARQPPPLSCTRR